MFALRVTRVTLSYRSSGTKVHSSVDPHGHSAPVQDVAPMKYRSRGFSLMELMVVLALAAAIFAMAGPSFRDFQRNNRLTGAANDVLSAVITSRAEALRRQVTVSMCQSDSPESTSATCAAGTGWIVFEDTDSDCVRDTGEEWLTGITVTGDVNAVANTDCLSFATTGFKRVVAGQPAFSRMLYCDSRGNTLRYPGGTESAARGVEIPPTGRGVVVKRVDEITTWNSGDDAVACP
jgi:type IV fimbrial biogenesis protein FimT